MNEAKKREQDATNKTLFFSSSTLNALQDTISEKERRTRDKKGNRRCCREESLVCVFFFLQSQVEFRYSMCQRRIERVHGEREKNRLEIAHCLIYLILVSFFSRRFLFVDASCYCQL